MTYNEWLQKNGFLPTSPARVEVVVLSPDIKAISIKNPYAWQIVTGQKRIEYRTWKTPWRGTLAIISSKRPDTGCNNPPAYPGGHILGIVTLAAIQGTPGDYEWLLTHPHPLPAPIPFTGRLGLYPLPADILQALRSQLKP